MLAAPPATPDESPVTGLRRLTRCSARSFLVATAATYLLGLAGMFGFCWYVNPWGNYGRTGYQRIYNARLAKAEYLSELPREQLPDALVLGSSNTMRYDPATIERLLGLKAFNFGVFWGRAEDDLCIVRHFVRDLQHRPALLIIGVDTWTFSPPEEDHPLFGGVNRRLLNTPQLARHYPSVTTPKLYWSYFIDGFSRQQLQMAWEALHDPRCRRETAPTLAESPFFQIDGTRIRYMDILNKRKEDIFGAVEAGTYPITAILQRIVDEGRSEEIRWATDVYDIDGFYPPRVAYLEDLLKLCTQENITVVFTLNPLHPVFRELLRRETRHEDNLAALRALLAHWQQQYPVVRGIVDAVDIESFGGDPDGFYDPYHPATRNCDPIIERAADILAEAHS